MELGIVESGESTGRQEVVAQMLAQARREGARAERARLRRRLILGWCLAAGLFLMLFVGSVMLMAKARDATPGVINEIVSQRRDALERNLRERRDEAIELVGNVFDFLGLVWLESAPVRQIRASIAGAREQLSALDAELRAALRAPFTDSGPLIENGPTRARYLANQLVVVAREARQLALLVFQALTEVRQSFADAPGGSPIPTALATMDALLNPFLGEDQHLHSHWDGLKSEITAWGNRVETNLRAARHQMQGDTLGQEFLERIVQRIF